jgi:hypothetical protein
MKLFSAKNLIFLATVAIAVGVGVKLSAWIPLPQPMAKKP